MTPSQRLAAVYRIAPIPWEGRIADGQQRAETIIGTFIIHGADDRWLAWVSCNGLTTELSRWAPLDAAKAAAESWYINRIASALVPASQSVEEAVEEIVEGLYERESIVMTQWIQGMHGGYRAVLSKEEFRSEVRSILERVR